MDSLTTRAAGVRELAARPILHGRVDALSRFTAPTLSPWLWLALWAAAAAALILSFVTGGRLASRVDVAIVQTYFVGLFVLQFAVLLFLPDAHNLLLVWPRADVAETLTKVQFGVLAGASLSVVTVVAHRWRAASRPRRRALLPSVGGSTSGVLDSANLV